MKKFLHIKGRTQTIAYWITLLSIAVGVHLILNLDVSLWWLLLSAISYIWFVLVITVGYHRLFSHRAFTCNKVWHFLFAFTGVVMFQGSPLSWAAVHHSHHKFADTTRDPHITDWRWWVGRQYGPIQKSKKAFIHLMRDDMQMGFHNYALLFPLGVLCVLWALSPLVLLYGYLLPLGLFFLVSNVHQSFSHFNGIPRNQPWLEFVLPTCGEWIHANHHNNLRAWRFGTIDLGAFFISIIKHEKCD